MCHNESHIYLERSYFQTASTFCTFVEDARSTYLHKNYLNENPILNSSRFINKINAKFFSYILSKK